MDRTSTTTGCLLHQGTHRPAHAQRPDASRMNPPIYTALVAEWWARGRTVPGWADTQWATLTALPATGTPDGMEAAAGTVRRESVAFSFSGPGAG